MGKVASGPAGGHDGHARAPSRRGRRLLAGVLSLLVLMAVGAWMLRPAAAPTSASPLVGASPTASPEPDPTLTPQPTPTPTWYPADTATYDLGGLPEISVFSVIPALPVDDAPFGSLTSESVRPVTAAPVWADPLAEPVAFLPRDLEFDGTTVPVIERQPNWVKVLLVGRQAAPSQGDPSQVTGWMRVRDLEFAASEASVRVSIGERTVDIVRGGATTRIADDFAWGTETTPTPLGRAFIMTTRVVPEYWYTRGHPIVYLSVQSPTLDGFGGASVAVTAFHYHDERSGPISNGCIRLGPEALASLAALPYGTPVTIRP